MSKLVMVVVVLIVVGAAAAACVARARLRPGVRYIVFVKPDGGPRRFRALATPEPHNRRTMRKVARATCKRCGRSPRVAKMKNVKLRPNQRLRLKCNARSPSPMRISWFKDGVPIRRSRRVRIKNKKRKRLMRSTLIIRRATESDVGEYVCRAKNKDGSRSQKSRVTMPNRPFRAERPRRAAPPSCSC
ncbi:pro-neuregulin-2, membrane-bound isoform-like [Pollicipes pollicipes]|uniref:pro-neuregulin-2, membrane-bound isoform-like n=1 Tax=Pollicipes pollicipes TaxID=41117 RepID=UPI001884CC8C|nr:pro-neuregulin-2, membrane-bound isoform-like [Pollicipes pollicipes]